MTGEAVETVKLSLSLISDGESFTVSTASPVTVPVARDAGGVAIVG